MSAYPELIPIFASAIVQVSVSGFFSFLIQFDYEDLHSNTQWPSYAVFLKDQTHLIREQQLYFRNMQEILAAEQNRVNSREVHQHVRSVYIGFRNADHPFVQWISDFQSSLHPGYNKYENQMEEDQLTYPIAATYIFEPPIIVTRVSTHLAYQLEQNRRIIQYEGHSGQRVGPIELIEFQLPAFGEN